MATSSGRRSPTILFSLALSHDGLISDQDQDDDQMIVIDEQIARTIRGYVDILSTLASRMVEFDRDADAQQLIANVEAFCVQLTSACSLGQLVDFEGIEWEYLKFRLEMDYFIAVREGDGGDRGILERIGDGAEVYDGTTDAIYILYYYYMQEPSSGPQQPKRQRLTNETTAS